MPKGADFVTAPGVVAPLCKLLVVIGLSAGGLKALITLLSNLRRDFDFPIIVVLHLHRDYKSVLATLLARRTGLRVQAAIDGKLTAGVIYVAPPDRHVTLNDGKVGISTVKAMGGTTIAQSPETAQFRSMPSAAIATGCVDLVLSSSKIGEVLGKLPTPANG